MGKKKCRVEDCGAIHPSGIELKFGEDVPWGKFEAKRCILCGGELINLTNGGTDA